LRPGLVDLLGSKGRLMAEAGWQLLAPDEPPAARVLRPEGHSDLLLVADHAGCAIPRKLGTLGLSEVERARHIAWDIGIAGTTERLSSLLDAPAVLQTYSRLVIDCNRQPHLETSIPLVSEATVISGNLGLSAAERAARRREIFIPYHDAIEALLDRRNAAGRRIVLVAMHSFTPVFKGVARAIEVGVLYNRDRRLPHILSDLLRREGDLVVGDNEPYAMNDVNDYTVPVHAEAAGLPYVEIEIRQDLIADAAGQAVWAARLARLLAAADARLREIGG
jgi:predicted N-formylglutamate amidohydrolase